LDKTENDEKPEKTGMVTLSARCKEVHAPMASTVQQKLKQREQGHWHSHYTVPSPRV
jgi:hypothetical protein